MIFKNFLNNSIKNSSKDVYLDYASATPLDERVKVKMEPFWSEMFANPGSKHQDALVVRQTIEDSRNKIAQLMGVNKEEIIFTSGGTESNNLAIAGFLRSLEKQDLLKNSHALASSTEHPSVIEVFNEYKNKGLAFDLIPVNSEGLIEEKTLRQFIKSNTKIISISLVNTEIGVIQDINFISKVSKNLNPDILVHTDASGAPLYLDVKPLGLGVDLMSLDGQKIYGPKGVGVLYKKEKVKLSPILFGGDQEGGLRPGSENTPLVVGFSEALKLAQESKDMNFSRVSGLRDYFLNKLLSLGDSVVLNGSKEKRIPNNINISILGEDSEFLFVKLDKNGIYCSTKSACLNKKEEGSYVIRALGKEKADGLRFTLGLETTKKDIDKAFEVFKKVSNL
jgi:cysteine desulfurase